ncbi:putative ABC transport system permease protein [Rhizobiales bacterium GAS113]|nr:putative ABC transport system permease protein [Rhizobiales bacterium GAS113]
MDARNPRPSFSSGGAPRGFAGLLLTLRLAWRDLRAGARGFGVLLACLAIGTGAIATVGSLAQGLADGLASQGRIIIGGDLSVSLLQREASPTERAAIDGLGEVAPVATLRAMARAADGNAALVEIKAVGSGYPRLGELATEPQAPLAELLQAHDGVYGAIVDPTLFARLNLEPGAEVTIGAARLALKARLIAEPDTLAVGIGLGPRIILSQEALRASSLLQPGSLVRWSYRVLLPEGRNDDAALATAIDGLKARLPQSGFDMRSRLNIAPQFEKNILRFTQFLALAGVVALLVGGVGVANSVSAFVERRRVTIAILKSLGASGSRAVAIMLCEVALLSGLGIAIGIAGGAALPLIVVRLFGDLMPVPVLPGPFLGPLALAALFGALVAGSFSLWPLGSAHDVPASRLFRDLVVEERRRPRARYGVIALILVMALIAASIGFAWDRLIASIAVLACAAAFLLLRGVGAGVVALLRRLPAPRNPLARLAIANLHRPGAATATVIVSLGLGVTLIVALAVIDATLSRELTRSLPKRAPNFYFLDVPGRDGDRFAALLDATVPGAAQQRVPMMRGRIVSLAGVPAEKAKAAEDVAWVLEGDRGITFSAVLPEGAKLSAGDWWPQDYAGPPLVSMERDVAGGLGLKIGDPIIVNVLGRDIEARIANLRILEWSSLAINFVMVFSPDAFAGAPFNDLATLSLKQGGTPQEESTVVRAVAADFPGVTSLRVKDALEAVDGLVRKLLFAVRGASAVSLASAVLVLAGALAAGRRLRLYDAMVLKTLGARRSAILRIFLMEYALLGAIAALFGLIAGCVIGAVIVTFAMKIDAGFDLVPLAAIAVTAVATTVLLGLASNGRILAEKPAQRLREL